VEQPICAQETFENTKALLAGARAEITAMHEEKQAMHAEIKQLKAELEESRRLRMLWYQREDRLQKLLKRCLTPIAFANRSTSSTSSCGHWEPETNCFWCNLTAEIMAALGEEAKK
jgi:hypothetical protein